MKVPRLDKGNHHHHSVCYLGLCEVIFLKKLTKLEIKVSEMGFSEPCSPSYDNVKRWVSLPHRQTTRASLQHPWGIALSHQSRISRRLPQRRRLTRPFLAAARCLTEVCLHWICSPISKSDMIIWPTFKSKWWTKITRGFISSVSFLSIGCWRMFFTLETNFLGKGSPIVMERSSSLAPCPSATLFSAADIRVLIADDVSGGGGVYNIDQLT